MKIVCRFPPKFSVLLISLSAVLLLSSFATKSSVENENTALAIRNTANETDNSKLPLETVNHPPVAIAVPGQIVNESSTVTLTGHAEDQDKGDVLSFLWEQTDGRAVNLSNTSSANPTFTAPIVPSDTELKFSLTVADNKGATSSPFAVSVTIKHINRAPLASVGQNQTVDEGYVVTLDGTGSKDPDGDPITYSWIQTGGSPVKLNHADKAITTFTAPAQSSIANKSSESELVFKLTVVDNRNATDSADASVIVKYEPPSNKAPVANAGEDQKVESGTIVSLDGNKSEDPEGKPLKYSWAQTTGTPSVTLNDKDKATATFTAPDVSSDTIYTFKLETTDEAGATGYDDLKVTVKAQVKNIPEFSEPPTYAPIPEPANNTRLYNLPILTARGTTLTAIENTALDITLEPQNDDGFFVLSSYPKHGTLSNFDANEGTLTYQPSKNYVGLDSFSFKKGKGLIGGLNRDVTYSDKAIVCINVETDPVNSPVLPVLPSQTEPGHSPEHKITADELQKHLLPIAKIIKPVPPSSSSQDQIGKFKELISCIKV